MSSLRRLGACASALALATGTTLAGAGIASAQDDGDESTGSLSSSSLNLGDTAADLELAAQALNGPVTVTANDEDGPTVTYNNESEATESCVGFTVPYSTIDEQEINPNELDLSDLAGAIELINGIEGAGGVALLAADEDGQPTSTNDPDPENAGAVVGLVIPLIGESNDEGAWPGTVAVDGGDSIERNAAGPEDPSAAVVLCIPDASENRIDDLGINFGIDKQVVADQINGTIPGGSLAPVSPDMISGGSVETGATVLGSLGSASSDDTGEEEPPADDEDPEEPPAEDPAE